MAVNPKIFRLEGVVQHYSWGGRSFLPEFLKEKNDANKPFAEYWMGAHSNAPSLVVLEDGSRQRLDEFIAAHRAEILGEKVVEAFGRLPYLFKVLDVHDMLSIQVHPNKKAAERDYAAENSKSVPVNDPSRNYKDDNHKPELMIALGDFWLLHGFKEPAALEKILDSVKELQFLLPIWKRSGYEGIYRKVMEMEQEEVDRLLQPLVDRIMPGYREKKLQKGQEDFWAARAYQTFCPDGKIDRGLFSIYLFNLVSLKKGDAIFQDAGILHAYLEGQNLELMANSDNVLRGGLTNKKIDVPELLKHVRFEPTIPAIVKARSVNDNPDEAFITPAQDFELHRVRLNEDDSASIYCDTADIFLVLEGRILATADATRLELSSGTAFLAIHGTNLHLKAKSGAAVLFRATVP